MGFAANYNVAAIYHTSVHVFNEVATGPHQHIVLFVTLSDESKAQHFPDACLLDQNNVLSPDIEYLGTAPLVVSNVAVIIRRNMTK